MNVQVQRFRVPLMGLTIVAFLAYTVWSAHTPGQPRTMRDFLFVISLSGVPFAVFLFVVWSLSGPDGTVREGATAESRRKRLAVIGCILSAASAALLLLLLPFWSALIEHQRLEVLWGITGMLLATAASLFGIIGSTKLRWPAIASVVLIPFWLLALGLFAKAAMD